MSNTAVMAASGVVYVCIMACAAAYYAVSGHLSMLILGSLLPPTLFT
jgi:hypothetical protein